MFFSFLEQKEQKRTKKNKKELKRTKKKGGRFGGTSGPMGPIHIINLICVISLFICYWLSPTTMVAISATILAGGQARFQLNLEVNINILISTLMI
jgi:Flp pilus assembly protein TadB